jgi:hypothetical protein
MASIAMHEEVRGSPALFSRFVRARWFWPAVVFLCGAGCMLVWSSALQLWRTGHTDAHWSRFVVAMGIFGTAALLAITWVIDRVLDLVEARVRHLAK